LPNPWVIHTIAAGEDFLYLGIFEKRVPVLTPTGRYSSGAKCVFDRCRDPLLSSCGCHCAASLRVMTQRGESVGVDHFAAVPAGGRGHGARGFGIHAVELRAHVLRSVDDELSIGRIRRQAQSVEQLGCLAVVQCHCHDSGSFRSLWSSGQPAKPVSFFAASGLLMPIAATAYALDEFAARLPLVDDVNMKAHFEATHSNLAPMTQPTPGSILGFEVNSTPTLFSISSSLISATNSSQPREIRGLFGVFAKEAGVLIGCPLVPDSLSDGLRRVA
jgi:hypothetical protein